MIAWFPDQHLIRMLGPQCFRRINPEGHDYAYDQYRKEQRIRLDITFLLAHLHLLPEAIMATTRAIEIAEAVDTIRAILRTRISQVVHIPNFWQHVRTGTLKITERDSETVRLQDGSTLTRDVDRIIDYGPMPGYDMLDPGAHEIARQLKYAFTALNAILSFGGLNINPLTIWDKDRRHVAKVFERGLKKAAASFDEIQNVRQFIGPVGIATLAGWGRHPGAPANFHAALDGRTLQLGRSPHDYQKIIVPETFFAVLPSLPRIGKINIDDAPDVHLDPPAQDEEEIA